VNANVSSSVRTVPGKPKTFGTGMRAAHPSALIASTTGTDARTHAPASTRRRQRGSLSPHAGRRGIAASRRDAATDPPHSGHVPSSGWARRSYPQKSHDRSSAIVRDSVNLHRAERTGSRRRPHRSCLSFSGARRVLDLVGDAYNAEHALRVHAMYAKHGAEKRAKTADAAIVVSSYASPDGSRGQ
jgi:hypothetical protein